MPKMGGGKQTALIAQPQSKTTFRLSEKAVDPILNSLFTASAGPLQVPAKRVKQTASSVEAVKDKTIDTAVLQSVVPQVVGKTEIATSGSDDEEEEEQELDSPPRKRRRVKDNEDIEGRYLDRLVRDEDKELKARLKEKSLAKVALNSVSKKDREDNNDDDDDDDMESLSNASSASNDLQDLSSDDEADDVPATDVLVHESLAKNSTTSSEEIQRTVFLSNVCISAIKSKTSRKILLSHLKSALLEKEKEKIMSIRFRSTAYASGVGPKKAAFAKKELMDQTMHSTNAYVVFSSEAAARRVALRLNGTVVLDRHLHLDSFANPTKTDNKRCVFIGNLPFVDEEVPVQDHANNDEAKPKRQKAKMPADAEEGLWRVFGKCGKIESVRVVRDRATRVGKGFAYVQFEDGNGVEKALLYDGKKFPPQLPRLLRVSRAKAVKKKEMRTKDGLRARDTQKGRKNVKGSRAVSGRSELNNTVFEGYRASSTKSKFKLTSKGKTKKDGVKPSSRSSKRGAAFKAMGGKKTRDIAR